MWWPVPIALHPHPNAKVPQPRSTSRMAPFPSKYRHEFCMENALICWHFSLLNFCSCMQTRDSVWRGMKRVNQLRISFFIVALFGGSNVNNKVTLKRIVVAVSRFTSAVGCLLSNFLEGYTLVRLYVCVKLNTHKNITYSTAPHTHTCAIIKNKLPIQ